MSELIAKIARWIWNKLIVLLLIVLMLLAANWFRSEWDGISAQIKQASRLEDQIDAAKKNLTALLGKAEEFGADARKKMEELNSKEKVTAALWTEAADAKKKYDDASRQVGWWQKAFDHDKVKKKGEAWIIYEAKTKAAQSAQQVSDLLKKAQENSPWVEHQKKIAANQAEIERLESTRGALLDSAGKTPSQRLVLSIRNVLPIALWTMFGIILTPGLIKGFLYFALAPLISRTKPVVVLPDSSGDIEVGPSASKLLICGPIHGLQCLSAVSPRGTQHPQKMSVFNDLVSSAFRL